jgi:hypothetical protein
MLRNSIRAAGLGIALVLALGVADGRAGTTAYCNSYAKAAQTQYWIAARSATCAGRISGTRWNPNFGIHYHWCYSVPNGIAQAEWNIRSDFLYRCTRGM